MQKVVTISQFTRSDQSNHANRIIQIVPCKTAFRMISIKNINPPIFLSWAKNGCSYIHGSPRDTLHIVFDNYSLPQDPTKVLSKGKVDRGYKKKKLV